MSTPRRPRPASQGDPIPTVDEVFGEVPPASPRSAPSSQVGPVVLSAVSLAAATGAVLAADAPRCGATRAEEVSAHAPAVSSSLRRGEVVAAVREVAAALGLLRHETVRGVDTEMHTAGVMMPVEPARPLPLPSMQADGGVSEVQPTPLPVERPSRGEAPARVTPEAPAPRDPPSRHETPMRAAGRVSAVHTRRHNPFE